MDLLFQLGNMLAFGSWGVLLLLPRNPKFLQFLQFGSVALLALAYLALLAPLMVDFQPDQFSSLETHGKP